MSETNGHGLGSDGPLMERLVGLIARLNEWVRRVDDKLERLLERSALLQQSSERAEREQTRQAERLAQLESQMREARGEIEDVAEDAERARQNTDPNGHRTYTHAELVAHQAEKPKDEGALVATARLVERVPASWRAVLFKLALSGGVGAALMEAWHRLTGH